MIKIILMLGVLICCSAGGEIAMTYGMKRIGELEGFHPRSFCDSWAGHPVRMGLAGHAAARRFRFIRS